jgi:HK97 family phage major capsid protein
MTPEEIAAAEKEAEKLLREKWDKELKEKTEAEKKRAIDNAASILQLAGDFQRNLPGIDVLAEGQKYIREDKNFKEFYDFCSGKMHDPEATRTADAHGGADEKDMKDYRLARAILSMSDRSAFAKLGIEREMHEHIQKLIGRDIGNGLLVPTSAFGFGTKRAQVAGTPGLGGLTIFETPVPQTFVEYLHNQLAFVNAGVTVLDNLSGTIPLVREANQHTFSFKLETVAPDSSDVTFTKETYDPKLGGSLTSISRQMLLQSPNVSEAWARRKLLGAVMRGMDRTIAYGAGGVEPVGFVNMTGPHGILGGGFNRDSAIDMRQAIKAANAEIGSFNFVANPVTVGTLQKKQIAANYPSFLCDDNNVMVGRPVKESNQVDEGDLFYGGWSNLVLLLWGYILVEANPWGSGWAAGDIQVKANIAMNVMAEHPEAISIAEGVN